MTKSTSQTFVRILIALLLSDIVLAFTIVSPTIVGSWRGSCHNQAAPRRFVPLNYSSDYMQYNSRVTESATSRHSKVLYQKLLHPSDVAIFDHLADYLENHFTLPQDLSIAYESLPCEGDGCILTWDSPMSPASDATRMEVSIVDIHTENEEIAPMVVVRKAWEPADVYMPPSMERLFADSENRILQWLDRGLDDFIFHFENHPRPDFDAEINDNNAEDHNTFETSNEMPFWADQSNPNSVGTPRRADRPAYHFHSQTVKQGGRLSSGWSADDVPNSHSHHPTQQGMKTHAYSRSSGASSRMRRSKMKVAGPTNGHSNAHVAITPSELAELDILKAAQRVMTEKDGVTSPRGLLHDVLEASEDPNIVGVEGSGFVKGAFGKANEVMKERHQRKQQALLREGRNGRKNTSLWKENDVGVSNINVGNNVIRAPKGGRITAVEELRRMFEAGEKHVDERISKIVAEIVAMGSQDGTTEGHVDALIAQEKYLSRDARELYFELSKLDCHISSLAQNPTLDIMSGPEESAMRPNKRKTKVRSYEQMEAAKQAKLIVNLLAGLKTVEHMNDDGSKRVHYYNEEQELPLKKVERLRKLVQDAAEMGIIDDPRLKMITNELWNQPAERFGEIAEKYKDLLLSEEFVVLVKGRLSQMFDDDLSSLQSDGTSLKEPHAREWELLGQLVIYTQSLLREARARGAELEAQQLEVVRTICKVAMNPKHTSEAHIARALADAVRVMRPLWDDVFVAYLKYAIAEEEARLTHMGKLHDTNHNQWLLVLQMVQQGVYAEISKGMNRYIDQIWNVVRMETPQERRFLLEELIDDMPAMDVRPFVQAVDNIVGCLGECARGDSDFVSPLSLGDLTNKLYQLNHDVKLLLPPGRIAMITRDMDGWAAAEKKKLLEARSV